MSVNGSSTIVLTNLRLENGQVDGDAAVMRLVDGSVARLSGCMVQHIVCVRTPESGDNRLKGGAFHVASSSLHLSRCFISNVTTTASQLEGNLEGGVVHLETSLAVMSDCVVMNVISNALAGYLDGGVCFLWFSSLNVKRCIFRAVHGYGVGIIPDYVTHSGSLRGGVCHSKRQSTFCMDDSILEEGTSTTGHWKNIDGGLLHLTESELVRIRGCTIRSCAIVASEYLSGTQQHINRRGIITGGVFKINLANMAQLVGCNFSNISLAADGHLFRGGVLLIKNCDKMSISGCIVQHVTGTQSPSDSTGHLRGGVVDLQYSSATFVACVFRHIMMHAYYVLGGVLESPVCFSI